MANNLYAHAAVAEKMSATPALVVKTKQNEKVVVRAAMMPRRLFMLSVTYSSAIETTGNTQAKVVDTILVTRRMTGSPYTTVPVRCSSGPGFFSSCQRIKH